MDIENIVVNMAIKSMKEGFNSLDNKTKNIEFSKLLDEKEKISRLRRDTLTLLKQTNELLEKAMKNDKTICYTIESIIEQNNIYIKTLEGIDNE